MLKKTIISLILIYNFCNNIYPYNKFEFYTGVSSIILDYDSSSTLKSSKTIYDGIGITSFFEYGYFILPYFGLGGYIGVFTSYNKTNSIYMPIISNYEFVIFNDIFNIDLGVGMAIPLKTNDQYYWKNTGVISHIKFKILIPIKSNIGISIVTSINPLITFKNDKQIILNNLISFYIKY